MTSPVFPIDFNLIRKTIANELVTSCSLSSDNVILEEPETQNVPRPKRPYMSFKITNPAGKSGDDSFDHAEGSKWNVGGQRKMSISFNCYGKSHEEAYNYMGLWQAMLGTEPVLDRLRRAGIAVWVIGELADLSLLLNTGYEGRSHMDVSFGIASNILSDFGLIESVEVNGTIDNNINTSLTVST